MQESGFVLIYRSLNASSLGKNEPVCKRYAWAMLIMFAAYRTKSLEIAGRTYILERGQLLASRDTLKQAFNWGSIGKVGRFLKQLKDLKWIDYASVGHGYLITIFEYDKHQKRLGGSPDRSPDLYKNRRPEKLRNGLPEITVGGSPEMTHDESPENPDFTHENAPSATIGGSPELADNGSPDFTHNESPENQQNGSPDFTPQNSKNGSPAPLLLQNNKTNPPIVPPRGDVVGCVDPVDLEDAVELVKFQVEHNGLVIRNVRGYAKSIAESWKDDKRKKEVELKAMKNHKKRIAEREKSNYQAKFAEIVFSIEEILRHADIENSSEIAHKFMQHYGEEFLPVPVEYFPTEQKAKTEFLFHFLNSVIQSQSDAYKAEYDWLERQELFVRGDYEALHEMRFFDVLVKQVGVN